MIARTARLAVLYTLEVIAALLALAIFAGGAILWRLASGPVDLEIARPSVSEIIADAFEAERAEIGRLTVSYDPALAALVLSAHDVRVFEDGAQVITAARRIEAGLALDLLLIGRAAPVMIAAEGGSFALVRRPDGTLAAGLGRPEHVAGQAVREGPGWEAALSGFTGSGPGDVLDRLVRVNLRGADIRVVDQRQALTLLFQGARAEVELSEERIEADLAGILLSPGGETPVTLGLESDRALEALFLDLRIRDLVPASVAPLRGPFAPLAGLDAPLDLDLVLDASREAGLRSALLALELGGGSWQGRDGLRAIEGGAASLTYDTAAGRIEIETLRLASDMLGFDVTGEITDLSGYDNALPSRARYRIESGGGRLDLGGVFPEPLRWETIAAQGDLDLDDVRIGFERLDIGLDVAAAEFTGQARLRIVDERILPDLVLEGPIQGRIGKESVLRFWPVDFALGARDWIRDSILAGTLSDAHLFMDIAAEDLARKYIEDEALNLTFRFEDADVRYVSTMTPLTGLSGEATLLGNSLSVDAADGQIGALEAETIYVRIPQLNPKGALARFGGTGRGRASDLIALLDEEPLGFATDYAIDPQSFEGEGRIRFEIGRPMYRDVPVEDIHYDVEARFSDVAGPAGVGDLRFTDGQVDIVADSNRLIGTGTADLAGTRADIRWEEAFNTPDDVDSTLISFSTRADESTLDRLGLPVRRFLDGMVGVEARLTGQGFDFHRVTVSMDLAEAAVALPGELWAKTPGTPAAAAFTLRFAEQGRVELEQLSARAPDFEIAASASLGADGRLLSAEAGRLYIDGLSDISLEAARPEGPEGRLHLRVSGAYFNARDLIDEWRAISLGDAESAQEDPAGLPLVFDGAIDTVIVREVEFSDVQVGLTTTALGVERFVMAGRTRAGPVDVRFAPAGDGSGIRLLSADTADAGALLKAFSGFDNAEGGVMRMSGQAPPIGEAGPVTGSVEVGAFTLERMPLLARILAAGSLEGLGSLLSGQGLVFERLESGFSWEEGLLQMQDARVAGPALGVTWGGVVDLGQRRLAVDGTLLPSYGMNSVLGEIPVVGDLLTSRRGEGVIGVTFSVQGPFEATRVTANPLSALAPGVFRRIFEGTSAERELEALQAAREREAEEAAEAAETEDGADAAPNRGEGG